MFLGRWTCSGKKCGIEKKHNHLSRSRSSNNLLSKSLSDDDLQELKACFELGFGFDSPEFDSKLSHTIPALELYHAVNKQYNKHSLSRSSSSSSIVSDNDDANITVIFNPGDYSFQKLNAHNLNLSIN
jgi:hypothetical protein